MVAAWKRRTNQRAVQTITRQVVEICHQMESWRRLLRQLERIELEREPAIRPSPASRIVREIRRYA